MKRTATIVGIAAALAIPAAASAGNPTTQIVAQVKPQVATTQVVTAHRAKAQRSTLQVAKLQRATAARLIAKRKAARLVAQRTQELVRLGDSGPCGSETFEIIVNGSPSGTLC